MRQGLISHPLVSEETYQEGLYRGELRCTVHYVHYPQTIRTE